MDSITYISIATSLVFATIAVTLWRKASSYHLLLQEAANKFEEARQQNKNLKAQLTESQQNHREQSGKRQKLEQQLSEAKNKNHTLLEEIKRLSDQPAENIDSLNNQIENLTKQVAALSIQLKEADNDRSLLNRENHRLQSEYNSEIEKVQLAEKTKIKTLEEEVTSLKSQIASRSALDEEALKKAIAEKDVELKSFKRKLSNQQHIMKSMRGLKEMTEERLNNWEKALRILASHTLGQPYPVNSSAAIGELVGSALESIGQELVVDDQDEIPATTSQTPIESQGSNPPL